MANADAPSFNIRALVYFDELVRTGSMRQAAENLDVAPTAVSRQIENLEALFGAELVERHSRGVKLTPAGELLAERAGLTLRELDHVHRLIDDLKGLERGRVGVYASGAVVASLLAPALAAFSLAYPKIMTHVTIASAHEATEAVIDARADIAVTLFAGALPGMRPRLRASVVYDAVMAASHPAAGDGPIGLDELARHALVMPDPTFAARRALDEKFAAAGVAATPMFETSSLEVQRELVLTGAAIALLPAATVAREREAGLVAVRPVADGGGVATAVEICIAEGRRPSFAAARLMDFLERFMQEWNAARP
jgi:DNA-binding transcriptional LysR family regulator